MHPVNEKIDIDPGILHSAMAGGIRRGGVKFRSSQFRFP